MCGITGFVVNDVPREVAETSIARMTGKLRARGPDDEGTWSDPKGKVFLGHRRLSIIDVSAAGHQPMLSSSGRFVIIFNGEIYNHLQIRGDLEADEGGPPKWRGHS